MTSPPSPPRQSPLHQVHVESGARMVPFAGWEMPLSYEGQLAEHDAVRRSAGIFDVSHMGQFEISGPGARAYLQYVLPADVEKLREGKSRYTMLLNKAGGVLDDLIVSRTGPESFFAVVNAATKAGDLAWMRARAHDFAGVKVRDVSDQWAMIAVQGPDAFEALDRIVPAGFSWRDTPAFTLHSAGEMIISRTGYTGEQGGEILCPPSMAPEVWRKLAGAGCVPCGLAARDSLRLEAGYPLYGNDLSEDVNPLEAKLSWVIPWKKEARFIGREALLRIRENGPERLMVPLESSGRKPLRKGDAVLCEGAVAGAVTSGGYSPGLRRGIALALVGAECAEAIQFRVRSGKTEIPCVRTQLPFVPIGLKA